MSLLLPLAEATAVNVWVTTGDQTRLLQQQVDLVSSAGNGGGGIQITVDPTTTFQSIEGYGASLTNSSASLLQNQLSASQRADLMEVLFSPSEGVGLNYLRQPMGSSDFTADGFYTYNDLGPGQTDPAQAQFSIDPDRATILPSLQQAKSLNPDLKLMGSPWSPPGWMKTSGSVIGGSLAPQHYASFATYLQKFVEAYEAEGLPIDALTLQNEPLFTPLNYPGSSMTAAEQIDLVKNHVGPAFAAAGLDVKLLAYDHNWDEPQYPIQVLNDPVARQYLAGSAFHGYAGDVSAQTLVHNAHPDKGIYFTELSGGDFAPDFSSNLMFYARNLLVGGARNYGKTVILWNLALDENGDPHLGGCSDCRGVVTIDSSTSAVTLNEEFYALGHASRFVQPGAIRIGSTSVSGAAETVAFRNPDGTEVMLAVNPSPSSQVLRVVRDGRHFRYTAPPRSLSTLTWGADGDATLGGADFDNGGFEAGGFESTGGSLDGWLDWGNPAGNVAVSTVVADGGEHSLRIAGQGGGANFSGVSQGVTVAEGDRVAVSASALVRSAEALAGGANSVLMKIEYYDRYGGGFQSSDFLGQTQITIADAATPADAWRAHEIVGTAPAGAVEARLVFVFSQPSGDSGAIYLDDIAFAVSAQLAGDYNGDGVVDTADYGVWRDAFGSTTELAADGDGDLVIDQDDYALWAANFGRTAASSAVALPEPNAAALVATTLAVTMARARATAVRSTPLAAAR